MTVYFREPAAETDEDDSQDDYSNEDQAADEPTDVSSETKAK
jgi:hypothetical protein